MKIETNNRKAGREVQFMKNIVSFIKQENKSRMFQLLFIK